MHKKLCLHYTVVYSVCNSISTFNMYIPWAPVAAERGRKMLMGMDVQRVFKGPVRRVTAWQETVVPMIVSCGLY